MRPIRIALITGALLASTALSASAQPWSGTVYGVYPEGILMSQGAQTVLVPHEHASFQLGGLRLDYSKVSPGQNIMVNVPQRYYPNVQVIPDRQQWVNTYHPHGGPPGQMKKWKDGKHEGKHGRGRGKKDCD